MSNELSVLQNNNVWECDLSLKEIREIYAPKANENEFKAFVGLGRATGLNPFLREIWLIKYDDKAPASIFIGRDGYRRSAQANKNYDWHHVESVYSNDDFQYNLKLGEIDHKQNFKDRGILIGAYCLVQKKNSSKPIYVFVTLKEYNSGRSVWSTKPETMIKKVAEAQALRMAFQELFAGSYGDGEMDREIDVTSVSQATISHQEHHKTFEGKSLSQSFTMDADLLAVNLESIANCNDKKQLHEIYKMAKKHAEGDRDASNMVSVETKKRQDYLNKLNIKEDKSPIERAAADSWAKEYDGAVTV